jgi:guanylate kinase
MLIITGRSCSGKDTIVNELIKSGYTRIVTFTTRSMRDKEVDGITYHFVGIEEFLTKYIDGFFLEARYYNTESGVWYYGSSISSYENAKDNSVCILTPSGLRKLRENFIPFTSFMIEISDNEILKRQELRGDNATDKKRLESERRFKADKLDFANIDGLIDFTIRNENRSAEDVAKEIDQLYKKGFEC